MRSPGAKNEFHGESTQPAITLILPQSSYTSSTTQIFLNVFISFIWAFLCHRAWLLLVHRCIGFCKSLDVLFCPLPMDVPRLFLDISKKTQAHKNSKLKKNHEKKTSKIPKKNGNSRWVELLLNWMKTQFLGGKLKDTPKISLFIIKYFQKLENICTFF